MQQSAAEILCEYGPFAGVDHVHGLTFDGRHVWFASGDRLNALDPASGTVARAIDVPARAGTAGGGGRGRGGDGPRGGAAGGRRRSDRRAGGGRERRARPTGAAGAGVEREGGGGCSGGGGSMGKVRVVLRPRRHAAIRSPG